MGWGWFFGSSSENFESGRALDREPGTSPIFHRRVLFIDSDNAFINVCLSS